MPLIKNLIKFLAVVVVTMLTLPSCAQQKDEKWQNRFTAPAVNQAKPQKAPAYIYHTKPNNLQPIVERKIDKQKIVLYANNRVMRMCREFRGCEKWARSKYALDTSFRITDVETTYWFSTQEYKWAYALYVQTWENGHVHAYKLKKPTQQEVFPSWEEINKFPGHPFPDEPSQHATRPSEQEIHTRWNYQFASLYPQLQKTGAIQSEAVAEEQILVWENGDPIWKLRLYARYVVNDDNNLRTIQKDIVLEVKQDSVSGSFTVSKGKWKPYIL